MWKKEMRNIFFRDTVIMRDPCPPSPLFDALATTFKVIFAKDKDIIKTEKEADGFLGLWKGENSDAETDTKPGHCDESSPSGKS